MSELAFTQNGDLFDVPAVVTGWRVRRLKHRGAPELVYAKDGRPLTIPIEADMNELRDAVGGVLAKYRLDPIDDDGKIVDGTPPAYVQVVKADAPSETIAVTSTRDDANGVLRDAMRLNTELAKSIVDKFPEMMQAAAELLRAADGAGLPARQPREIEEADEDEDVDAAPAPNVGIDINAIIAQVVPMLVMAFATGDKAKLPSLAEMLDWRKAVPKAKELAPIDVAPASASTETKPAPSGDVMERVGAVLAELTPEERMLAIATAQELPAEERAAWFAELAPLSVADAVARVRKALSGKKERVS